jgi:hypothetical protein
LKLSRLAFLAFELLDVGLDGGCWKQLHLYQTQQAEKQEQ